MSFTHNINTGSLFKNERRTSDKAPDYKGTANWQGQLIEIAAWVKEGKNGRKYFSLKLQRPYAERQQGVSSVSTSEDDVEY